ncbi:MAG TPA: NDP-sugar synthase [Acidimicrobiales bacterium]|nr:NDP-sugar synthase [Acidimicrobiales bacterium]
MDVIVLVGGEGTRLRPLTYDVPKQMLPVLDRTLVEHVVGWLARGGMRRAVLSLGYRPDAFMEAFPSGAIDGVELVYAVEPEPLDTAGAVRFAADKAGVEGTFLVLNGDVLTDLDISSLVEFHVKHEAEASIHLTPVDNPSAFGVVPTDSEGRVSAFVEKPPPGTAPTNLINAGTYVLEPGVLDLIEPGRPVSIERETFPALVAEGTLFAMASDDYWLDAGTPQNYLQAQLDILHGLRAPTSRPRAPEVATGVFVAAGATVDGLLSGVSYLGEGAYVATGASVTDSVIGARARVLAGSHVARSALLPAAVVGEGCTVTDSIVGPGTTLGPSSRLEAMTVVRGGVQVPAGSLFRAARYPQ